MTEAGRRVTRTVAGFVFDSMRRGFDRSVVLIRKERPEWQVGLLNAIGGKIEPLETAKEAIRREFREEAGADIENWNQFATFSGADWSIDLFYAIAPHAIQQVRTATDEEVVVCKVATLDRLACVPDIRWFIPMALSVARGEERSYSFDILENRR